MRILSLSGGGVRGLIPCSTLAYIEHETGKPIHQLFDLIVGTSTGGLIACAMAQPAPLSALAVSDIYLHHSDEIFSRSWLQAVVSVGSLNGPKYGAAGLERVLQRTVGQTPLSAALTPVAVTSYDISARAPRVLSSYGEYRSMPMWHAARATSAGPTFFPPFQQYIDGGVLANNPSALAVAEACKLRPGTDPDDCLVLSLGTGVDERPIDPHAAAGWGQLSWIGPLVSIFTDGAVDLVDYGMRDVMPAGSYLYLQPTLVGSQADMDNTDRANLLSLQATGNALVQANRAQLDSFLAKL